MVLHESNSMLRILRGTTPPLFLNHFFSTVFFLGEIEVIFGSRPLILCKVDLCTLELHLNLVSSSTCSLMRPLVVIHLLASFEEAILVGGFMHLPPHQVG